MSACWKVWRSCGEHFEIVEGFAFGSLSVATEVVVDISTKEPELRFVVASEARPWCVACEYVNGRRVAKADDLSDEDAEETIGVVAEAVKYGQHADGCSIKEGDPSCSCWVGRASSLLKRLRADPYEVS